MEDQLHAEVITTETTLTADAMLALQDAMVTHEMQLYAEATPSATTAAVLHAEDSLVTPAHITTEAAHAAAVPTAASETAHAAAVAAVSAVEAV